MRLTLYEEARALRSTVGAAGPLLPAPAPQAGRPVGDDRTLLNGIFWRLNTGAPWRDLPRRYGPWQTAFDRFNKMRKSGLLARILQRLRLRLNDAGLIDPESFGHAASAC